MKIHKLHIQNLRGIVDLNLDLGGKNTVISGPNGVGKSAVVDAIDFLLRGDISRLAGAGTGDVSTAKHGPHIGHTSDEAVVTATIQSCNGKIFSVSRTVAQKDKVSIDQANLPEFNEMVAYAQNGAHCLTRKELLCYILTTPASRADQIQTLLNISDTKNTRDAFQKLKKTATKILKDANDSIKNYSNDLRSFVGASSDKQIIEKINALRATLGGNDIVTLESRSFTENLSYRDSKENEEIINIARSIQTLIQYLPIFYPALETKISSVQSVISQIVAENTDIANANSIALIKAGLALMDGSGRCPLCLHEWPTESDLLYILNHRREKSEKLSAFLDKYTVEIEELWQCLNEYKLKLTQIPQKNIKAIKSCAIALNSEIKSVDDIALPKSCGYSEFFSFEERITNFMKDRDNNALAQSLKECAEAIQPLIDADSKSKSDAWQALNSAREVFAKLQTLNTKLPMLKATSEKANCLFASFDTAQEKVLNELFVSISERFTEFYKIMHSDDEESFTAILQKEGAAVNMSVDFYGLGQFPPMAFHSEGHQDSMGIALFFALMEKLTSSEFGLAVLDDVVMSVDIEHRKNICKLLKDYFEGRQFIITTHDCVWAKNLINEGVVERKNNIEFLAWNVEQGPITLIGKDIWQVCRIKAETDLHGASAFFRREMECYFENICDKIHARVRYNNVHKWDYGQYMNASYVELKELIKKAKNQADAFNLTDKSEELKDRGDKLTERQVAVNADNWVTNILVHYNPTYVISKTEFLAAVKAMEAFCQCFKCDNCDSIISAINNGENTKALMCKCGNISYALKQ